MRTIRQAILNGEIAPGERLVLDKLRRSYGISLSPLREALSRLATDGLVLLEGQRGFRVTPISRENLEEITVVRQRLEALALRWAIQQGDDAWEASVLYASHRLDRLTVRSKKIDGTVDEDWEEWHRRFHFAAIQACNSPLVLQFCHSMYIMFDRYRRLAILKGDARPVDTGNHDDILEAVLARDADKACELMCEHIQSTADRLVSLLQDELPYSTSEENRIEFS